MGQLINPGNNKRITKFKKSKCLFVIQRVLISLVMSPHNVHAKGQEIGLDTKMVLLHEILSTGQLAVDK